MTIWKARRVGDRILCGRPVPDRGYCNGLIADVTVTDAFVRSIAGPDLPTTPLTIAIPPEAMVEDPPGSRHYRLSARAKRQSERGGRPTANRGRDKPPYNFTHVSPAHYPLETRASLSPIPKVPWFRPCPVCNVLAEVTADLLAS
jgi:hypothetical protein